jgi:hypothetical protein
MNKWAACNCEEVMGTVKRLLIACGLVIAATAANAETLTSFHISGTFEEELECVNGGCGPIPFSGLGVSGTLVLNAGGQQSITLVVSGLPPFVGTGPTSLGDAGEGVRDDVVNSDENVFQIFIPTPLNNNADFTGYVGGPIGGEPEYLDPGTWATPPWTVTCAGPFGPTSCGVVLTDLVGTISA